MRHSGLQRDVLALYRRCFRVALNKPELDRNRWITFVREEFLKFRSVPTKDIRTIEYLLRQGQKRLETLSNPAVKRISF